MSLSRIVAEYLVARALGVADGVRKEWDTHDVTTPTGVRVEVKSAAYVQTWAQRQESTIVFGIAPTRAWDEATGKYHDESRRQADVYVFALLAEKDTGVNPLDLDQWKFFVLATLRLDGLGAQKEISLASMLKLRPVEVHYAELAEAVATTGTRAPTASPA